MDVLEKPKFYRCPCAQRFFFILMKYLSNVNFNINFNVTFSMPGFNSTFINILLILLMSHVIKSSSGDISTNTGYVTSACVFQIDKDGEQYLFDLSRLAENTWIVEGDTRSASLLFYMSVCSPLKVLDSPCNDSNTFVCLNKTSTGKLQESHISSLGNIITGSVDSSGELVVVGTNGSRCETAKTYSSYNFSIYFLCSDQDSLPVYTKSRPCSPIFVWSTPHACRKTSSSSLISYSSENCSVSIPGTTYVLDIFKYKKKDYYKVTFGNRTFEINICGPVVKGHCNGSSYAACEVDNSTLQMSRPLGHSGSQVLTWDDGSARLVYNHTDPLTGNLTLTEIRFVCDTDQEIGILSFLSQDKEIFKFEFRSAALCSKIKVSCQLKDKENLFDLNSLAEVDYWKVSTNDQITGGLYISVCHSLRLKKFNSCSGWNVGACLYDQKANTSRVLAQINKDPVLNSDLSLTLTYPGFATCKLGGGISNIKLNLLCSPDFGKPYLLSTDGCEYEIEWKTPSACPLQHVIGEGCVVEDKTQHVLYDLNGLRNHGEDYSINVGGVQYLINVCGSLINHCSGDQQTGICKVDGTKKLSYGRASQDLEFKDSSLSFKYLFGDSCGEDTFSSQIIFMCMYSKESETSPEFITEQSCTAYFVWRTHLACPPLSSVPCSVYHDGKLFDLSPLTLHDQNYVFVTPDGKSKFVINVCRSIHPETGARCSSTSSVCRISLDNSINKFVSGGTPVKEVIIKDGNPSIEYKMGSPCGQGTWSTVIDFQCNHDSKIGHPVLMEEGHCEFHFLWETAASCPITSPSHHTHCQLFDSENVLKLDLSPLFMSNSHYQILRGSYSYLINICGSVHSKKCQKDSGVCVLQNNGQNQNSISGGIANSDLKVNGNSLYLKYSNGSACSKGAQYQTVIQFLCPFKSQRGPYLVGHDSCNIWINWYTDLVCQLPSKCSVVVNNRSLDLSVLASREGNYVMQSSSQSRKRVYLNICSPLYNISGGSTTTLMYAASVEHREGKSQVLNLGSELSELIVSGEQVEITYVRGDACPENKQTQLSSKISLYCSKDSVQVPKLISVSNCQYLFSFGTELLCDSVEFYQPITQSCEASYPQLGVAFDLAPLKNSNGYYVGSGPEAFCICICDYHSSCPGDAAVTRMAMGKHDAYGLVDMGTFVYSNHELRMTYAGPSCSKISGKNKSASILFQCDPSATGNGYEGLSLFGVYECLAIFKWKTSLVCRGTGNGTVTTTSIDDSCEDGDCKDSYLSHGAAVGVVLGLISVCLVIVVIFSAKKRHLTGANRSSYTGVRYTRVSADEPDEDSLLLGQDGIGDDQLISG